MLGSSPVQVAHGKPLNNPLGLFSARPKTDTRIEIVSDRGYLDATPMGKDGETYTL